MSAQRVGAVAAPSVTLPRERFPGLSPGAYVLVVEGDGMRPRFAAGDVLVIDPERVPKPGDFVVLYDGACVAQYDGGELGIFRVIVGCDPRNEAGGAS